MKRADGDGPRPPSEVLAHYEKFPEENRLSSRWARLEFERTKDILSRILPKPPLRILDVGGAAGAYSFWLSAQGYEVHLVDASQRLVEVARERAAASGERLASLSVADARRLPQADGFAGAVLLMGPLYHLTLGSDREQALREACRVLDPSGVVVVAAISRYASALDGLARKLSVDSRFVKIRDRDLVDGQHRNDTGDLNYFTTAYFHRPEDLIREVGSAGFRDVNVFGVEGPGWILPDVFERLEDTTLAADLLEVARRLEAQPSIVGASAHLLAVGRRV